MATATHERLGEARRRIARLEVNAQRGTADARSRMQPYITTVRRAEESAQATAREQAAAVDARLEQLDTELELAEHRVAAEFAATQDQLTHAVDAELHRWDAYLDRMQVKAAARTGAAMAELDAAEDRGRRGKTVPEVVGEPEALPWSVASEGRLTSVLHVRRAGMKEPS